MTSTEVINCWSNGFRGTVQKIGVPNSQVTLGESINMTIIPGDDWEIVYNETPISFTSAITAYATGCSAKCIVNNEETIYDHTNSYGQTTGQYIINNGNNKVWGHLTCDEVLEGIWYVSL